eukprot:scaffold8194_cov248-Pinguiococcus_pyrenoidosus.AAC.9
MLRSAAVGTGVSVAAWTSVISIKRSFEKDLREFYVGSTDDQIADEMQSGDLLLFSQDPTALHLPSLVACIAWRNALHSSFDHVAVVLKDDMGQSYTFERGPIGWKLTPYPTRVTYARANEVMWIPLSRQVQREKGKGISEALWKDVEIAVGSDEIDALGVQLRRRAIETAKYQQRQDYLYLWEKFREAFQCQVAQQPADVSRDLPARGRSKRRSAEREP